jgi:hypothetical protein
MKRMNISIGLVFTFVSFYSMGCASLTVPVSHSFAESGSQAATIHFDDTFYKSGDTSGGGTYFINFAGAQLPKPERGTRWAPGNMNITFPAGEPLELTVRAYYYTNVKPMLKAAEFCADAYILAPVALGFLGLALVVDLPIAIAVNFDKEVVFECPPLEAGRNYTLKIRRKARGVSRALLLTYADTDTVVYEHEF